MKTDGTFMLPSASSTIAGEVDSLFYFIFYTAAILFVLVIGVMVYFVIRYKKKDNDDKLTSSVDHNNFLEITWTVIPAILVMVVFFWGFKIYMKMNVIPSQAMEIKVTAQKWFWSFDYAEGVNVTNELTVPVNTPVKLLMSSQDVLHSFFVPSFRTKMDVLPNRYSMLWFEATETGEFDLYCTEYCGLSHSEMIGKVIVVTKEEYDLWVEKESVIDESIPLDVLGKDLFKKKACYTCHSLDGTRLVGPTFKDLFGSEVRHKDGSTAIVDENYIRESLLEPNAKIIEGYSPVMPTFQGQLKDREIDGLSAFIKSLK
jgi:cytochrome c oxidase subunit II